ncbi:hypothetical protein VDGD_04404 [Verticillium dahliae]|nr:hypothetical protein VdG1_01317 [Verticillium dahliae VDG1]RBQ79435.1 hypothetical protein VDGD_04404 [Verticillium dahliae]
MTSLTSSLLAAAVTSLVGVSAHYNFESLIVNGEVTGPYQYVRSTTNSNSPVENVASASMTCNQGGNNADIRARTATRTVQAGDELGFAVNADLGHPGPLSVYLSKAPGAAKDYVGDGGWSKIYALTTRRFDPNTGVDWAPFPASIGIKNFTFTLPAQTPPGEYLLRAEHVGLHAAQNVGGAQFYIGCAQIKVEGSGTGTPGPTVKIPGVYTGQEPGLKINLYWPPVTSYSAPGPVTWPNRCEDHTANLNGRASDGDCTPLQ